MCRSPLAVATALLTALIVPVTAAAQASVAGGESTFHLYCGSCHGTSGRGDGPMASMLRPKPADLTQIAKRAGGTFDASIVARIIDGRAPVKGHGGSDMPVWGDAFAKSSDPTPVEDKIGRLVAYLETIQVRP